VSEPTNQVLIWCHCGHQITGHNDRGICLTWPCGCHRPRPGGEPRQPHGWQPPVPVGDERLGCAYCPWSCPARYQNASGSRVDGGRDGNIRLAAHAETEHRDEIRRAKAAARARRRYAEKKVLRDAVRSQPAASGEEAP
jgi:hypothetical protein